MENYALSAFLTSWALIASYLCSRFCIFDRPILEEYISQKVKRGPHLHRSCLHVTQNGLPHVAKEMHLSFESLAITNALGLQAYLMGIQHDASLGLSWRMTPFPLHPKFAKPAFVLVRARGQGYSWLLNHLSIHFTLHTIFSP
jgi:hypothetical protein